jgi:hypothetical protein
MDDGPALACYGVPRTVLMDFRRILTTFLPGGNRGAGD